MQQHTYFVKADWDAEANVWYVSETDVPGLACEADSPRELIELLEAMVPDLVELNGQDGLPEIPYSLMLQNLKAHRAGA